MAQVRPPEEVLYAFSQWLQQWAQYALSQAEQYRLQSGGEPVSAGEEAASGAAQQPGENGGEALDERAGATGPQPASAADQPPQHWLDLAQPGPPAHWLALFEEHGLEPPILDSSQTDTSSQQPGPAGSPAPHPLQDWLGEFQRGLAQFAGQDPHPAQKTLTPASPPQAEGPLPSPLGAGGEEKMPTSPAIRLRLQTAPPTLPPERRTSPPNEPLPSPQGGGAGGEGEGRADAKPSVAMPPVPGRRTAPQASPSADEERADTEAFAAMTLTSERRTSPPPSPLGGGAGGEGEGRADAKPSAATPPIPPASPAVAEARADTEAFAAMTLTSERRTSPPPSPFGGGAGGEGEGRADAKPFAAMPPIPAASPAGKEARADTEALVAMTLTPEWRTAPPNEPPPSPFGGGAGGEGDGRADAKPSVAMPPIPAASPAGKEARADTEALVAMTLTPERRTSPPPSPLGGGAGGEGDGRADAKPFVAMPPIPAASLAGKEARADTEALAAMTLTPDPSPKGRGEPLPSPFGGGAGGEVEFLSTVPRWPELPERLPPVQAPPNRLSDPLRRSRADREQRGRPWNA